MSLFTVKAAVVALTENHVLLFTHNYDIHCIIYYIYILYDATVYTRDGGGVENTLLLCSSPFPPPRSPNPPKTTQHHPPLPTTFSNALSHRFPISCTRAVLRRRTTRRCIVSDKLPQTLWKTVSLIYWCVIVYVYIYYTQQLCILIYCNMI